MELKLPISVTDHRDITSLLRELDALDNFMLQATIRKSGDTMQLPRMSRQLEDIAKNNGANLLVEGQRKELKRMLEYIKEHAPLMHISFASDPSAAFVKKVVEWFRREIHEYALVQIGLQPNIAAGCMLRTSTKYYDMSMRKSFQNRSSELVALIRAERP